MTGTVTRCLFKFSAYVPTVQRSSHVKACQPDSQVALKQKLESAILPAVGDAEVEVHCSLPPTMVEPEEMIENVAMIDSIEVCETIHIVESWNHSLMIETGFAAFSDQLFEISTLFGSHPPVLFNIDSGDFDVVWLDFRAANSGRQFEICDIMIRMAYFTHVLVHIFLLLRHFKIRGRIFSKWGRLTGTVTRDGRGTRLQTTGVQRYIDFNFILLCGTWLSFMLCSEDILVPWERCTGGNRRIGFDVFLEEAPPPAACLLCPLPSLKPLPVFVYLLPRDPPVFLPSQAPISPTTDLFLPIFSPRPTPPPRNTLLPLPVSLFPFPKPCLNPPLLPSVTDPLSLLWACTASACFIIILIDHVRIHHAVTATLYQYPCYTGLLQALAERFNQQSTLLPQLK
ncbi:hypothetical protein Taro_027095, partial [Colocasia esculenta]|nr:hypothetical protein [Colocasia esculenta]